MNKKEIFKPGSKKVENRRELRLLLLVFDYIRPGPESFFCSPMLTSFFLTFYYYFFFFNYNNNNDF